jgi:TPR repeat protein
MSSRFGLILNEGLGIYYTNAVSKQLYPDQGDSLGHLNLGVRYRNGVGVDKNAAKAAEYFRNAAESGNARAQYCLGFLYYNGEGVAPDREQAFKWFSKSAEQGFADAECALGKCYHDENRPSEAVMWYRKAAEKDLPQAQYNLGHCYAYGDGVAASYAHACKWFLLAASQGNEAALKSLPAFLWAIPADDLAEGGRLADQFKAARADGEAT